jgi:hypothetical protein
VELTIWKRPALQTLVALVYRVADLQNSEETNVSLSLQGRADLQKNICYYTLLHVITYYCDDLQTLEQASDVHRPQHRVNVQATTIGGQWG